MYGFDENRGKNERSSPQKEEMKTGGRTFRYICRMRYAFPNVHGGGNGEGWLKPSQEKQEAAEGLRMLSYRSTQRRATPSFCTTLCVDNLDLAPATDHVAGYGCRRWPDGDQATQ